MNEQNVRLLANYLEHLTSDDEFNMNSSYTCVAGHLAQALELPRSVPAVDLLTWHLDVPRMDANQMAYPPLRSWSHLTRMDAVNMLHQYLLDGKVVWPSDEVN